MYSNTYDLGTLMSGTIALGAFLFWLFNKFAQRDSDGWDKSYESKRMRITRIILMCIWGLYVVIALGALVFSWNSLLDNQKVSLVNGIIIGLSLFYYELTLRQSPRSVWVKVRKVIAYILICLLFGGVWPTTVAQFTTLQVPGVYGDAMGVILVCNALIYGISILIIWLLLRLYNSDRLIPYKHNDVKVKPSDILDMHEERVSEESAERPISNEIPFSNNERSTTILENAESPKIVKQDSSEKNVILDKIKKILNALFQFFKRIWKWLVATFLLVALINGGIALFNYLHNDYFPKKKLDKAVSEIVKKFNNKETQVEYAYYILTKKHDWGYGDIFCEENIMMIPKDITQTIPLYRADITQTGPQSGSQLREINNEPFLSKKERKEWFKTFRYKKDWRDDIEDGSFKSAKLERRFRNEKFKEAFSSLPNYVELASNMSPAERDAFYLKCFYRRCNGNQYINNALSDYCEEAFNVIESQAYQGDAKCQFYLGDYYYGDEYIFLNAQSCSDKQKDHEQIIRCDREKAAYWWLESAKNGHIPAYNKIGICYKEGIGVSENMDKAIEWIKKGAEAGDPLAQKNYGDLFLEGVSVNIGSHQDYHIDIEQAKYWWRKSAAQGNEEAKERLQKIYE